MWYWPILVRQCGVGVRPRVCWWMLYEDGQSQATALQVGSTYQTRHAPVTTLSLFCAGRERRQERGTKTGECLRCACSSTRSKMEKFFGPYVMGYVVPKELHVPETCIYGITGGQYEPLAEPSSVSLLISLTPRIAHLGTWHRRSCLGTEYPTASVDGGRNTKPIL